MQAEVFSLEEALLAEALDKLAQGLLGQVDGLSALGCGRSYLSSQ